MALCAAAAVAFGTHPNALQPCLTADMLLVVHTLMQQWLDLCHRLWQQEACKGGTCRHSMGHQHCARGQRCATALKAECELDVSGPSHGPFEWLHVWTYGSGDPVASRFGLRHDWLAS